MTHRIIWKSLNAQFAEFIEQQQIEQNLSEYEQEENEKYSMASIHHIKTLLATPMGLVSVNDAMSPFKYYELWQFDTTRKLTNEVVEKLKSVDGVEALKMITPYKALIAIGLAFHFKYVRPKIESVLRDDYVIVDDVTTVKVNKLKADLSKYAAYQIIVQPNGETSFTYLEKDCSNRAIYEADKTKFEEVKKLSGAIVIENENGLTE